MNRATVAGLVLSASALVGIVALEGYTPSVTVPLLDDSTDTFYAPAVHRVGDLDPPFLENENSFYAPTVFLQPMMASRYGSARRSESARGDRLAAATRSNRQTSRR